MKHCLPELKKLILAVIVFLALFAALPTLRLVHLLMLLDIGLAAVGCLYWNASPHFFGGMLVSELGCLAGFAGARFLLQGRSLRWMTLEECIWLLAGLFLWLCEMNHSFERAESAVRTDKKLFKEQDSDKERLLQYIQDLPIVGIHAKWGDGKSFLWNEIRKTPEIRDQFEVVQIDLLVCNLDEIEAVLLQRLETILERNRVYPENAQYLKAQLGKSGALEKLTALAGEGGFSDAFDFLQAELERLPKKVLLNFEDIDRIQEEKVIQKIFAISEKLASERVHVVFQYNKEALPGCLQKKDYLEKYVPFNVGLTPISFASLVEDFWEPLGMENLPLKKESLIFIGMSRPSFQPLNSVLNLEVKSSVSLEPLVSIRKVRFYLEEVKVTIQGNPEFATEKHAEAAAAILLIKHFFEEEYRKLSIGVSPMEVFRFEANEREYTLWELAEAYRKRPQETPEERETRRKALEAIFKDFDNTLHLWMLMLLGYDIPIHIGEEDVQEKEQPVRAKNDKLDHLVWNTLANGASELTDAENEVAQLLKKVFAKPQEEWLACWKAYQNDRYHKAFPKDNGTVMKMIDDPLGCSFRAMHLAGKNAEVQTQLLKLLFMEYTKREEKGTISSSLLECLSYCDWNHKRDLVRMVHVFNQLEAVENPEKLETYQRFFTNSMGAIVHQRYCNRMESWMFRAPLKDGFAEYEKSQLQRLEQQLEEEKKEQKLGFLREELDELIRFAAKNEVLLSCTTPMQKRGWRCEVKYGGSAYPHQAEIDRLKEYRKTHSSAELEQEMKKSWDAGNLYYAEANAILKD